MESPMMGVGGAQSSVPDLSGHDPTKATAPVSAASSSQLTPGTDIAKELNPLKLTEEQLTNVWEEIERSKQRRENNETEWDILLDAYKPVIKANGVPEDVKTMLHFRNVHTKIGQLFVRSPRVICIPKGVAQQTIMVPGPNPLGPMLPPVPVPQTPEMVVPIRSEVINSKMGRGPGNINGTRLMDELLFDNLAWAGICFVKTGYKAAVKYLQKPVMEPAPIPQAPALTGMPQDDMAPQPPAMQPAIDQLTGQPKMQTVPVVIHRQWYADRFSPKKGLLDSQLTSTRYQEHSRWIGMEGFMPKDNAVKEFGISEGDIQATSSDDRKHLHSDEPADKANDLCHYYETYWRTMYLFPEQTTHPYAITQVTLIQGMRDKTAVCRPCPDQTWDEEGKLTPDSLINFPILAGTLRDFADSPYPKSDSGFTNTLIKEVNTYRQQGIKLRDAAIGKYFFDSAAFDEDDINLLRNGDVGEFIPTKDGLGMQGWDKIFFSTAQVKASPDDYRMASILKQDIDETLGISANQAGTPLDTVRSATEIADFSQASAGRQEKEKERAVDIYLSIVENIDCLVTRYADDDEYVSIVGEDGKAKLQQWNKYIIQGPMAFDIEIDSAWGTDSAKMRQQDLQFYQIVGPDPLVNRAYVLRKMAARWGYDPSKMVASPEQQAMQPPHPTAKPPAPESHGGMPNGPGNDGGGANRNERQGKVPAPGAPPGGGQALGGPGSGGVH